MKDDDQLMYEAYVNSLMSEAPIGLGDTDEPYQPGEVESEKLKKYSKDTLDDNSLNMIVDRIKRFLEEQPNGIFPGDIEEFRQEIKLIILDVSGLNDTKLKINKTNAFYAARVIRNGLDSKGVIDINASGDKVEVQDISDSDIEDAVEDGIEDALEGGGEQVSDAPNKFDPNVEYNVDPLASDTLPKQHRDVAEYVAEHDEDTGRDILNDLKTKMLFNNPAAAGGFDGNQGKLISVLNDLVTAGVMIPMKQTREDQPKDTETFDPSDKEDVARADRDYIDRAVKQAEWGSQTPSYGLEDY
tara:strand:- start:187 stop:1086 length:900 start_codon:yes stop_codon:yes gene_type:complete